MAERRESSSHAQTSTRDGLGGSLSETIAHVQFVCIGPGGRRATAETVIQAPRTKPFGSFRLALRHNTGGGRAERPRHRKGRLCRHSYCPLPGSRKKGLSERDICTKFITPALRQAGWDEMLQIREEVGFTKGRIIVRGKLVSRGRAKRADYSTQLPLGIGRTIPIRSTTLHAGPPLSSSPPFPPPPHPFPLSASNWKEPVFPVPPLAEQHRIVAKVDELMALCDRLEASLIAGVKTRRRLLEALLAEALTPADDVIAAEAIA